MILVHRWVVEWDNAGLHQEAIIIQARRTTSGNLRPLAVLSRDLYRIMPARGELISNRIHSSPFLCRSITKSSPCRQQWPIRSHLVITELLLRALDITFRQLLWNSAPRCTLRNAILFMLRVSSVHGLFLLLPYLNTTNHSKGWHWKERRKRFYFSIVKSVVEYMDIDVIC